MSHAGAPPLPDVFDGIWKELCAKGWSPGSFSVTRDHASAGAVISSNQAMSTDTGPVIELVTSPAATLGEIATQLASLQTEARAALDRAGCVMLGVGVHPAL